MSIQSVAREAKGQVTAGIKVGGRFANHERQGSVLPANRALESEFAEVSKYLYGVVAKRTPVANDRDDIVQDATLELFRWAERHGHSDLMRNHKGIIAQAAHHHITRHANGGEHHTAHAGREMLQLKEREIAATLGRPLSSAERNQMAEEVRLSFPPGRRPKLGYQHGIQRPMPLAMTEDEEGDLAGEGHVRAPAVYDADPDESEGAAAFASVLDRLGSTANPSQDSPSLAGPDLTAAAARAQIWDTFHAADSTIPEIIPHLTVEQTEHASAVIAEDGAAEAAKAFLDNKADPAVVRALFAPFSNGRRLTEMEQVAVADRLASKPALANELWKIALQGSIKLPEARKSV